MTRALIRHAISAGRLVQGPVRLIDHAIVLMSIAVLCGVITGWL